jgi:thiamine-phosphate pyrophosphorylase
MWLFGTSATTNSPTPHFWLEKYFTDGIVYPISDSVNEIVWLIDHGAKVVQLRDKNSTKGEVYQKAEYICEYIAQKTPIDGPVLFILNDYAEIGAELSVAGVHVGQDDENLKKVRRLLGTNKIIGRSNQSIDEIEESIKSGADYVSIGPVFPTPTKSDRQPVGIESVVSAAKQIKSPWVAIGGIDAHNASSLHEAGAKNIAVVRAARDFFV